MRVGVCVKRQEGDSHLNSPEDVLRLQTVVEEVLGST